MFILIFLGFTLLFGAIGTYYTRQEQRMARRINKFLPRALEAEPVRQEEVAKPIKFNLKQVVSWISPYFKNKKVTGKWRQRLEEAGVPLKPEEFLAVCSLLMVSSLFFALLLHLNAVFFFILPILCWVIPVVYIRFRKEKRLSTCALQLPQALGMMATAMKSGFSFIQAMQIVAKEVPDPLGPEFGRTIREINLGISVEEAFKGLLIRLPNDNLNLVTTAILIQRSTGGNLAQILETIEETITERVRIKEDLRTLTAQGRMSAWIISLLPIVLGLILNLMSPDYFSPMLHHPLGKVFLGVGILSGIIGWVVIQKIVRIEV